MSVGDRFSDADVLVGSGVAVLATFAGALVVNHLLDKRDPLGHLNALSPDDPDFDAALQHVLVLEDALRRGQDVRTLRNIKGLTFQEWAWRAGWSEAAKKLTGMGDESPEIEWQMGEDPVDTKAEYMAEAIADLASLDLFLGREPPRGINVLRTR